MTVANKGLAAFALALGVSAVAAGPSRAAIVVTSGLGAACYQAARDADLFHTIPLNGLDICTRATESAMDDHDTAGTFANRGVLYMIMGDLGSAMNDFQKAVAIAPKMGEAHVNLGAAMVGMRKDKEGADEITAGLALGSAEPEKAYFNRAVAEEHLGDVDDAYDDYMKASQLKPSWKQPKQELTRFTVKPKGATATGQN